MRVVFAYENSKKLQHEAVATQIVTRLRDHLELPERIEIHFVSLTGRVYGGVDNRFYHRIAINDALSLPEMFIILVHELIHVSQRHTGEFVVTSANQYYWQGRLITDQDPETLSHQEYENLPWEADVRARLPNLIKVIL